jgi:hypothetical protein
MMYCHELDTYLSSNLNVKKMHSLYLQKLNQGIILE